MDEYESAQLKLALLKENFDYRQFYRWFAEDPYERCPELRRPEDTDQSYSERTNGMIDNDIPLFCGEAENFGFNAHFILETQNYGIKLFLPKFWRNFNENKSMPYGLEELESIKPDDVLALLNPANDLTAVKSQILLAKVPELFLSLAIIEITDTEITKHLLRFQRAIVIDLSRKKCELLKDIDDYITGQLSINKFANDNKERGVQFLNFSQGEKINFKSGRLTDADRNTVPPFFSNNSTGSNKQAKPPSSERWEPDKSRLRKESWDHLEVWKLRKKKMTFIEIAISLSISEQTAKDRFYRAFELTQGRTYNPIYDLQEMWTYRIDDIGKTCASCEKRESCTSLCPDMLLYADQDQKDYSRELLVDSNDFYPDDEGE